MRLFSWNVNGVRAATKKGLFEWLEHESPDILCIQETKAHVDQLGSEILKDHGYNAYWHSGERRGYSGVATFCKNEPLYFELANVYSEMVCHKHYANVGVDLKRGVDY